MITLKSDQDFRHEKIRKAISLLTTATQYLVHYRDRHTNGQTNYVSVYYTNLFPQIDIIGAIVIVWMVRGKIIRSVLCNIVRNNCAQCNEHTYERT